MKASIQIKLLAMCILLVLLTTVRISTTYYVLTKQDKHRESRQRIQIAFDIMLDNVAERLQIYISRVEEAINKDIDLYWVAFSYNEKNSHKTIQQLDQVTQQNAMMSESLATSSAELAAQTEHLRSIMRFFRITESESGRDDRDAEFERY